MTLFAKQFLSADEQLEAYKNAPAEWSRVTALICAEVVELLEANGISVTTSNFRTKTAEKIKDKSERLGLGKPVHDIHAVRLILQESDIPNAVELIFDKWPTPETFPWGLPRHRDYGDPLVKAKFNPFSCADYSAVHLNISLKVGARVAEIHLMTPEEYARDEATRSSYENAVNSRQAEALSTESDPVGPLSNYVFLAPDK